MIRAVEPTPLDAAERELAELYRRLALARPMGRERIELEMEIARVRKRIEELTHPGGQAGSPSSEPL
jgi:hypothetical protein